MSKVIYYNEVYNIALGKPGGAKKAIKRYYMAELKKLELFYKHNVDFYKNCNIICSHKTLAESIQYAFRNIMKWKKITSINFVQITNTELIIQNIVKLYDLEYYLDILDAASINQN